MEAIKLFLNNLFVWVGFAGSIIGVLFLAHKIIRFLKYKLSFRHSIKAKRKSAKIFSYYYATSYDLRENLTDEIYAQFLAEKKEGAELKLKGKEKITEKMMLKIAIDKAISNLQNL